MSRAKILFALSGSIAAYKACQVLSSLVQEGHEVQVICTPSTLNFVGPSTLEGLSGRPALWDTFESGRQMDHIHLVDDCDLVLLCPATADCLNRLAAGIGDNLLTSLFLALDWKKPLLIAPAMNTRMWEHPATQRSVQTLSSWGAGFIEPGSGLLACGTKGAGRLAEPEQILEAVKKKLSPKSGKRVLITAGGTRQAIDGVREISNQSTGRTGCYLAESLARWGHHITLLHSDQIAPPTGIKKNVPFRSYEDLERALQKELGEAPFDAVIHLAAVSDYAVDHLVMDGKPMAPSAEIKIPSSADLSIRLKRQGKILDKLRDFSCSKETRVIAFKLTQNASEDKRRQAAEALLKKADVVVQNDLSEITSDAHPCRLYLSGGTSLDYSNKGELARALHGLLE